MLTRNDYQLAESLKQCITGTTTVTVREGTPLAALMEVSIASDFSDITSQSSPTGLNVHDAEMERIVSMGRTYLEASLHRARGVVLPMVNSITEDAQQRVTDRMVKLTEFEIRPVKYPSVLDVPSFIALADAEGGYLDTLGNGIPGHMIPNIDFDTKMDVFKLGIEKIDTAAREDGLTPDFCKYVLSAVCEKITDTIDIHVNAHGVTFSPLALYVVRTLLSCEDKLDITLSDGTRTYLDAMALYLSNRVRLLVSRRERGFEKGTLITSISRQRANVNNDVYKKYLRDGGRPEVIMGAILKGAYVTLSQAKEEEEMFLDVYDSYIRHTSTQVKSMRAEAYRSLIPSVLLEYIKDDEELASRLDELAPCINKCMRQIAINSEDIYPAVRQLVCNVIYPNSDTLLVLSRIDDLMAQYPDMDSADAATACYTSLLVDFYMSQVVITGV